ncbi:hypothetical protein WMF37_40570 [Sorangium sp. So ce291]|uniref:hypothetical protein n=1 Tax=Sorangium sp. So ce291 TaxID=3133294 RepID=UPI003F5E5481
MQQHPAMAERRGAHLEFDPYAPGLDEVPYPVFARFRAEAPVFHWEQGRSWLVFRHEDVVPLLRDSRFTTDQLSPDDPGKLDAALSVRIDVVCDTIEERSPARADAGIAFSGGAHYCIGATLARLEGRMAIDTLLSCFPEMELAGPAIFASHPSIRKMTSLPILLRASAR